MEDVRTVVCVGRIPGGGNSPIWIRIQRESLSWVSLRLSREMSSVMLTHHVSCVSPVCEGTQHCRPHGPGSCLEAVPATAGYPHTRPLPTLGLLTAISTTGSGWPSPHQSSLPTVSIMQGPALLHYTHTENRSTEARLELVGGDLPGQWNDRIVNFQRLLEILTRVIFNHHWMVQERLQKTLCLPKEI